MPSSETKKKTPIKRPTAETHTLPRVPSMDTIEAAENKLSSLRSKLQDAEHHGDTARANDLRYGAIPEVETKIKQLRLRKKLRAMEKKAKDEERSGNFANANEIKHHDIPELKEQLSALEENDNDRGGGKGDVRKKEKSKKKGKYPGVDPKNSTTVVDDDGDKYYDAENSIVAMMDHYGTSSGRTSSSRVHSNADSRLTGRGFKLGKFEEGQVNFLEDRPATQTYGRRIALYMADKYKWYNPWLGVDKDKDGNPKPSLERAWAFFEHVTLPRYIAEGPSGGRDHGNLVNRIRRGIFRGERQLSKAEPGERDKPTKLYSAINTPMSQMADFGLGYGLYFSTLRSFAALSLVAGLLQFPNMLYYSGSGYGGNQTEEVVPGLLQGSAICVNRTWVPCSNCVERCKDCTVKQKGSYHQELSYFSERAFTFYEAVPVLPELLEADPDRRNLLNITDYINWEPITEYMDWERFFSFRDELFTKEKFFDPLEADYGIRYLEDRIEIGNPPVQTIPCQKKDCIFEFTWPQLIGINDAYLEVGRGSTIADDIELFEPTFALKNNCVGVAEDRHGYNGYCGVATVAVLVLGLMFIRRRQDQLTVEFDEDEQTAQDYSITIHNPPEDAYVPKEWKQYFESAFSDVKCKVTVCTVDVSNDTIVQRLVQRREALRNLEIKLPVGTIDNGMLEQEVEKARDNGDKAIVKLYDQLQKVTEKAKNALLDSQDCPATQVFITFETELAQRAVLEKLTVGAKAIQSQNKNIFGPGGKKYLFRGYHVLDVSEPEEPSTIRWQELDSPTVEVVVRLVVTTILTTIILVACWIVVLFAYIAQPAVAPYVLTVFTIVFPMIAKMLMDLEVHRSESTRQAWLFMKIAFFNIAITALLLGVFTPFHATLDEKVGSVLGLIPAIHALFFSQLGVTPIMQLLDLGGTVGRHLLAPRAKTQEEMNMNMRGTEVYLAERYGNMHKFFFLMLWYSVVYPQAFFMGSFALYIAYFVDRFR